MSATGPMDSSSDRWSDRGPEDTREIVRNNLLESQEPSESKAIPSGFPDFWQFKSDPGCPDELTALIAAEIAEVRKRRSDKLSNAQEPSEGKVEIDPSEYPELWNINTLCVGFWKSLHWPVGPTGNMSERKFVETSGCEDERERKNLRIIRPLEIVLWTALLGLFPILYNFLLMITISGVYDEGLNLKTHIRGDGYYESWSWRFSGDAKLRTQWVPEYDKVGGKLGLTSETVGTRNMLQFRDAAEIVSCQEDELYKRINNYTSQGTHSDFWPLMAELQKRERPFHLFSHCIAWEYASLCYNLIKANEEFTGDSHEKLPVDVARQILGGFEVKGGGGSPWYFAFCYPTDQHLKPLMTTEMWRNLIVSTDEMRKSSANLLMPARLEEHHVLVRWVMAKNLGDCKSLDSNDGSFSTHLYHHSHMVYYWSVGDAAYIELLCVATLNFYLYYSAIYPEMQQMLEQVILSCTVRSYEAAYLEEGVGLSAHAFALRAAIVKLKQRNNLWYNAALTLFFIFSEFFCDIFLSLRFLFLGIFMMACAMIVTLNHGNINVIISVVALTFILDIDDCFMRILGNCGFKESGIYSLQILPAVVAVLYTDDDANGSQARPGSLQAIAARNLRNWPPEKTKARSKIMVNRGNRVLQFWSLLLTTFLLGLQQYFTIWIAINANPLTMKDVLNWVFQEFSGIPWIRTISFTIFGFSCGNTLCYSGIISIPALVQTGLCLIWVYYFAFLNVILVGVLAWYSDVAASRTFWDQIYHNAAETAVLIRPALVVHVALCIIRPLILVRKLFSIPTNET